MKRLALIAAVLLAGVVVVVLATGASNDSGGYRVRAIFDNAAFVIPGEDVKVAGVRVGKIESLDVTPDKKAAVVLAIDEAKFHSFRSDASCLIRPQSLIGEKFIECAPTVARGAGAPEAPLLRKIDSGSGKGQYLLPSTNTSKAVDLDLINNIARLPLRQRLTILVNEFGTGLAGNGQALNAALKKSDPTLKALDDVLQILAEQNRTLSELAVNGDTVLAPLAKSRDKLTGFINSSGKTAEATAEKSAALEENFKRFPAFLRELGPTMDTLGELSAQFTPVIQDLSRAAPTLNSLIAKTPAFTKGGSAALTSLGDLGDVAGPALQDSRPLIKSAASLARTAIPLNRGLADTLSSLKNEGGINRLMDFVFFGAGANNGFDQYGHYLRARLVLGSCQSYVVINNLSCTANFNKDLGAVEASAAAGATAAAAPRTATPVAAPAINSRVLTPAAGTTRSSTGAQLKPTDPQSAQPLLDYLLGE